MKLSINTKFLSDTISTHHTVSVLNKVFNDLTVLRLPFPVVHLYEQSRKHEKTAIESTSCFLMNKAYNATISVIFLGV